MPLLRRVVRVRLLWPAVLALFVVEVLPRPQVTTELPVPETVWRLADLPPGAVHGWYQTPGESTYALWHQTIHDHPVTWAYVSRLTTSEYARTERLWALQNEGRLAELMDEFEIRYVVRANDAVDAALERACRPLWRGPRYSIFARHDDPVHGDAALQRVLRGPTVSVHPGPDGTLLARVECPSDPGAPFVLLASEARAPATEFGGGFVVELAEGPVMAESMHAGSAYFAGNHGRLDAAGRGEVRIAVPPDLRVALGQIHVAAVVRAPGAAVMAKRVGPVVTVDLR
jgi:hypothetical protein